MKGKTMKFWPYYELREDGFLYDEDGKRSPYGPFEDEVQANAYLVDNDIRGTVR